MNATAEIHVAGQTIADHTISRLTDLGFHQNRFVRHVGVVPSKWRGTVHVPVDEGRARWAEAKQILAGDEQFSGTLEHERIEPDQRFELYPEPRSRAPAEVKRTPSPLPLRPVRSGEYKQADLHISIELSRAPSASLATLESMSIPSVDRPSPASRRIFTLTFLDFDDGLLYLTILHDYLESSLRLSGKIFLERTVQGIRLPEATQVLPTIERSGAKRWIEDNGALLKNRG